MPLTGKLILDLSAFAAQRPHALAIAMAGKLAVEYGATVVRPVPHAGDPLGTAFPRFYDGTSALGKFLNAGKQIAAASKNFDAAIGDTPSLSVHAATAPVKVRVSVFDAGEDPPMSELGLQALSGLLSVVNQSEGRPWQMAGHQPAYAAGLAACTGMLAALRAGGQEIVDVSLFGVTCWLNWKLAASTLILGKEARGSSARSEWHTIAASDGYVALVYTDKNWLALRDMIGDPRLLEPEFATRKGRQIHRDKFDEIIAPWFRARTREEITAEAQARRIPIGPVRGSTELLRDAQNLARGFLACDGAPRLPVLWDGRTCREASDAA